MTNTLAFVLGVAILGAVALDLWANEGLGLVFLGRKALTLLEWLAFWR